MYVTVKDMIAAHSRDAEFALKLEKFGTGAVLGSHLDVVEEWRGEAWNIEVENSFPFSTWGGSKWAVSVAVGAGVVLRVCANSLEEALEMDGVQVNVWLVEHASNVEMLNISSLDWVGVGKSVVGEQNEFILAGDLVDHDGGGSFAAVGHVVDQFLHLGLNHGGDAIGGSNGCESGKNELLHN